MNRQPISLSSIPSYQSSDNLQQSDNFQQSDNYRRSDWTQTVIGRQTILSIQSRFQVVFSSFSIRLFPAYRYQLVLSIPSRLSKFRFRRL